MEGLLEPLDVNHILGDFKSFSLCLNGEFTKINNNIYTFPLLLVQQSKVQCQYNMFMVLQNFTFPVNPLPTPPPSNSPILIKQLLLVCDVAFITDG